MVVGAGNDRPVQPGASGPLDRRDEVPVAFSLEEEPGDLCLDGLDLAAGGGVGAQNLVIQLSLEPHPAAVFVDRRFIDPTCGADLRRLRAEQRISPTTGDVKIAFLLQSRILRFPPWLAVVVVVVPVVEKDIRPGRAVHTKAAYQRV